MFDIFFVGPDEMAKKYKIVDGCFGMRHKTAGFYHVLSVSVVLSVCVESAMESNDVLTTCFCAVSLGGTMRFAMSVPLEETAFGSHASLKPADPSFADFLEHLTAACPRP